MPAIMPDRLFELISKDQNAMLALKAVRDVGPPSAYIAAGFIRNRYWDSLYGKEMLWPDADVDVVYFDKSATGKNRDIVFERALEKFLPTSLWQVRNQARMHNFGNHPPFSDLSDALCHWAETATAVGVQITDADELRVISPFGLDDLYAHVLRITPSMKRNDPEGFEKRLSKKRWRERWPALTVVSA